ncbi:SusC/RagA family TonB-linked outer membrane protein [Psychroserpens sp. Hel_I_66]|uniref:SusC/RagA family TonB-linked outer membrane protein n=1 Tax=Psychroserpens sp. Hel_I_66 TaxID=1250004 RepID=UPI001E561C0A|nr:TonB-dependent receptor [Psychroserpens sp. Hel_I_66]
MLFALFFLFNLSLHAQSKTITGTVTDEEMGSPVPGVTVQVKGTSTGAVTDFDGNFSLTVENANATLVFSYIGYITQEVNVAGKNTINVVLKQNLEALNEVVVIGYGTARKSDLTGSVVTIGGDDLKEQGIQNVAETLTGRLAGVQVLSTEGSPDAEVNIKIRGAGSLTQDSSPLIIVDGFPVNSLNDISPTDIENISVLKDASSTAIYGSRGANGVVIVTTKSGKTGKIAVSYNMFYGVNKLANTIDVLSPEDYVKWQYEYALLDDTPETYEDIFGLYQDYDQYVGMKGNNWQKQIYGRTGEVQSRDLSIRGGSEKINFNFNYALFDQKAIQIGSNFKRNNLSLALQSDVSDKIDVAFTVRYSDSEVNGGGANEQNEVSSADSRLKYSVAYSPIAIPQLVTTNTDEALNGYLINPFVATDDNQRRQLRRNLNMLGSFGWEIVDNLKFKSDFGLNTRDESDYRFYGRSTYYSNNVPPGELQGQPSLLIRDRKNETFRNANTLRYDFKNVFGEDHSLDLLVGEEMIVTKNNLVTSEVQGLPNGFGFENALVLTTQGQNFSVDNFYSPEDKLLSFFGRANYAFKNRYLLTATYRVDGSSKFLGDNIWGYFPSGALAWKISEESFLEDVDWLTALKLRLSYGESGNNNIPTGQTVQSFTSSTTNFINNVPNYLAPSDILANPDLKWETTVSQNIGLDYSLFNGRVSGAFELYKNVTQDLLLLFPTPGTGYEAQYRNIGELQNTGVEASLNIAAIEKEKYGLNLAFNIGLNDNRVNSLGELIDIRASTNWASSQIGTDYIVKVGDPIGLMYGYKNDGRYEVSDFDYDVATGEYTLKEGVVDNSTVIGEVMPGSLKLKDINGDGVVNEDDNTVIGNANPDHIGGMVLSGYAYGFDFSAAFNWSVGFDVYNANKIEFTTATQNGQYRNLSTIMADGNRWTNLDPATGQLATDPTQLEALNANTTLWSPFMQRNVFSDWAVEDGSYIRLNTLTLGYTLPEFITTKLGVDKLRFYATANNVFIITNYSGLDPEVSTRRRTPLTPRVDYSPYPRSRQFVFGFNLNF